MNYRLGLDVGTNSLGWAVLGLLDDAPRDIIDCGARIFSEGRDAKTKTTLKSSRTEKRSARRRRDRFLQRQAFLTSEMTKAGIFPDDEAYRKQLELLDPYEIRHLALHQQIPIHHIGRALFHLNQRRGFKSNRKDKSEERTSGMVSNSIRALLEQMNLLDPEMSAEDKETLSPDDRKELRKKEAETRKSALQDLKKQKTLSFGSFLYTRRREGQTVRARPHSDKKLYDVYPTRELLADEFSKILSKQAEYYPNILTDETISKLYHVIFDQRKLKPQERGICTFYTNELRTFKCMPSFQRYRMVQDLNGLEWFGVNGTHRLRCYPEVRDEILHMMEHVKTKKGEVTFGNMRKVLKKHGLASGDETFNHERPKRKGFVGNLTSKVMRHEDCVGPQWDTWSLEQQDDLIDKVSDSNLEDEEVVQYLQDCFNLRAYNAENTMNALLLDGTASVSLRAANRLYHEMLEHNILQPHAVEKVAAEDETFTNPFTRAGRGELLNRLPYYGEAFQDGRHIIPGKREPKDKHDQLKFYGGVSNPTVHIALNQIRQVVNELIERYGHPSSISIELARNLPEGQEGRAKIEKEQTDNQKKNEAFDEQLAKLGQSPNRNNRLLMALWTELSTDPNNRLCPFTGTRISIADLFNGSVEIDHLIPFSQSLDDSRANKILCTRQANRDKGNRTPFDAFGDSPNGYDWAAILERIKPLSNATRWRFQQDAMEVWLKDDTDFSARHLNDTRYISRLAREYLETICPSHKIDVVTGRLTALLRGHWGLNSILRGHNEPEVANPKKMRDDHRHHAIDAIVIAMTSRSMLQRVSTSAGRAEDLDLERLFVKNDAGHSAIEPWVGFRDDVAEKVRSILVSHKTGHKKLSADPGKTDGALHKETAYGIVSGPDAKGLYQVTTRKPMQYFNTRDRIETIRDDRVRNMLLGVWESASEPKDAVTAVKELARQLNVKSCRIIEPKKVIPIKDKEGNIYKAYDGNSNWGMEIYEFPSGHEKAGKWVGFVIQRYQANQSDFRPGQTFRPHPAAKLVMRLQINDVIEVGVEGERELYRVQLMSAASLICAPLNEANVDARSRDTKDAFKYKSFSIGPLQKANARKVHISPTGRKSYERRK